MTTTTQILAFIRWKQDEVPHVSTRMIYDYFSDGSYSSRKCRLMLNRLQKLEEKHKVICTGKFLIDGHFQCCWAVDRLLPCPFCGKNIRIAKDDSIVAEINHLEKTDCILDSLESLWIGPICEFEKMWNRRAIQ